MDTLVKRETRTEFKHGLAWRLHRDYPPCSSTVPQALDTSTGLSSSPPWLEFTELSADITRAIAEAVVKNMGLPELSRAYVELISQIPEVRQVLLTSDGDSVRILTVIDAPAFDRSIRNQVYQAQQTVLESIVGPTVEFRLINCCEVKDELSQIIPPNATVLYAKR